MINGDFIPITTCQRDGRDGFKYGESGHCYTHNGTEQCKAHARKKAAEQGRAVEWSKSKSKQQAADIAVNFVKLLNYKCPKGTIDESFKCEPEKEAIESQLSTEKQKLDKLKQDLTNAYVAKNVKEVQRLAKEFKTQEETYKSLRESSKAPLADIKKRAAEDRVLSQEQRVADLRSQRDAKKKELREHHDKELFGGQSVIGGNVEPSRIKDFAQSRSGRAWRTKSDRLQTELKDLEQKLGISEAELEKRKGAISSESNQPEKYSTKDLKFENFGDAIGQQYNGTIIAKDPKTNKEMGSLNYVYYQGEWSIGMVEVLPEFRRKGVATALVNRLKEDFDKGDKLTMFGNYATDEGQAFMKAIGLGKNTESEPTEFQSQISKGRKEPWEMTENEWISAREASKPEIAQSNFTKRSASEAQRGLAETKRLTFGVREEDSKKLKDAMAGKIKITPEEADTILERLNAPVRYWEVIDRAVKLGYKVPDNILEEYRKKYKNSRGRTLTYEYLLSIYNKFMQNPLIARQIKQESHVGSRASAGGQLKAKYARDRQMEDDNNNYHNDDLDLVGIMSASDDVINVGDGESGMIKSENSAEVVGDIIETETYYDVPTVFCREGVFVGSNGIPTLKKYENLRESAHWFLGAPITPKHIATDTVRPSDRRLGHIISSEPRDTTRDVYGISRFYKKFLNQDEIDKINRREFPGGSPGYFTPIQPETGEFGGKQYHAVELGPYVVTEYATFFDGTKAACERDQNCGPFQNSTIDQNCLDSDLDSNNQNEEQKQEQISPAFAEENNKGANDNMVEDNAPAIEPEMLGKLLNEAIEPIFERLTILEEKFTNEKPVSITDDDSFKELSETVKRLNESLQKISSEQEADKDTKAKAAFAKLLNAASITELDKIWPEAKSDPLAFLDAHPKMRVGNLESTGFTGKSMNSEGARSDSGRSEYIESHKKRR